MIYCTYNSLNMFRALICPSSGARDYMCVFTTYGVQCLGCWWSAVRCRTAGYASGMREAARAAYKCPKHVEQIISAINHSVASSWFSSLRNSQSLVAYIRSRLVRLFRFAEYPFSETAIRICPSETVLGSLRLDHSAMCWSREHTVMMPKREMI